MVRITICPTCGSNKIQRVCRDLRGEFKSQPYTIPSLEFYECPECGEKIYDRQAMRKIEAHSPAFAKTPQGRKARSTARV